MDDSENAFLIMGSIQISGNTQKLKSKNPQEKIRTFSCPLVSRPVPSWSENEMMECEPCGSENKTAVHVWTSAGSQLSTEFLYLSQCTFSIFRRLNHVTVLMFDLLQWTPSLPYKNIRRNFEPRPSSPKVFGVGAYFICLPAVPAKSSRV